ncbi:hypothetical protein B1M_30560, partial [Burkholderia sp. TJI49]
TYIWAAFMAVEFIRVGFQPPCEFATRLGHFGETTNCLLSNLYHWRRKPFDIRGIAFTCVKPEPSTLNTLTVYFAVKAIDWEILNLSDPRRRA